MNEYDKRHLRFMLECHNKDNPKGKLKNLMWGQNIMEIKEQLEIERIKHKNRLELLKLEEKYKQNEYKREMKRLEQTLKVAETQLKCSSN